MVTQDHMDVTSSLVINQLLQDLGDFFIGQCNVADGCFEQCILFRPRQLDAPWPSCNTILQRASSYSAEVNDIFDTIT